MRQIVLDIDCNEMDCGKCDMQMEWHSALETYIDCVLDGETISGKKGEKSMRTVACRTAEAKLMLIEEGLFAKLARHALTGEHEPDKGKK